VLRPACEGLTKGCCTLPQLLHVGPFYRFPANRFSCNPPSPRPTPTRVVQLIWSRSAFPKPIFFSRFFLIPPLVFKVITPSFPSSPRGLPTRTHCVLSEIHLFLSSSSLLSSPPPCRRPSYLFRPFLLLPFPVFFPSFRPFFSAPLPLSLPILVFPLPTFFLFLLTHHSRLLPSLRLPIHHLQTLSLFLPAPLFPSCLFMPFFLFFPSPPLLYTSPSPSSSLAPDPPPPPPPSLPPFSVPPCLPFCSPFFLFSPPLPARVLFFTSFFFLPPVPSPPPSLPLLFDHYKPGFSPPGSAGHGGLFIFFSCA